MVDRIRWDTVSYLPFYYVFFQFLLLTIFNLQANILTTKDILSNLAFCDRNANETFWCWNSSISHDRYARQWLKPRPMRSSLSASQKHSLWLMLGIKSFQELFKTMFFCDWYQCYGFCNIVKWCLWLELNLSSHVQF